MSCYCGNSQSFELCCEPFLKGQSFPETAEQLMRSRYSAYVTADIAYLEKTLAPESRSDFNKDETYRWSKNAKWKELKILKTQHGLKTDQKGVVEFIATYEMDGQMIDHHEVSKFRQNEKGQWFFVDGDGHTHKHGEPHDHHHHVIETVKRQEPKIGRNDPCTCGSGKKFKKCCGST